MENNSIELRSGVDAQTTCEPTNKIAGAEVEMTGGKPPGRWPLIPVTEDNGSDHLAACVCCVLPEVSNEDAGVLAETPVVECGIVTGHALGAASPGTLSTNDPLIPDLAASAPVPATHDHWRAGVVTALIMAGVLLTGMVGGVQSAINNRVGIHFEAALMGTTISFIGGAVSLFICVCIEAVILKLPLFHFSKTPRWYQYLPGAVGVAYVTAVVAITPYTGFTLFFIASVAGQLIASTAMDQLGVFDAPQMRVTWQKAGAILLAIGGACLCSLSKLNGVSVGAAQVLGICIVCAFLAGVLLPIQVAINRQASDLLPSKLQIACFSFTMGSLASLAAVTIQYAVQRDAFSRIGAHFSTTSWWMYFAGPCGAIYIASGIFVIRIIGSAAYFISLICGQLGGSSIIDATGFLGTPIEPSSWSKGTGVGLVILAAILHQAKICPSAGPKPARLTPVPPLEAIPTSPPSAAVASPTATPNESDAV